MTTTQIQEEIYKTLSKKIQIVEINISFVKNFENERTNYIKAQVTYILNKKRRELSDAIFSFQELEEPIKELIHKLNIKANKLNNFENINATL